MKTKASLFAFAVFATAAANAATMIIDLDGNTKSDGWDTLTAAAIPGSGGFPGYTMWNPVNSQVYSDINHRAQLTKLTNGPGGGPYFASGSIYFGGFSADLNYFGGTLAIAENNPLAGLQTVVFQIEIGEAWTYDFYNDVLPQLSLNYGDNITLTLEADYSAILQQTWNGTVEMPTGDEDVYINLWGLQWDLSGYEDINSFSINFSAVQHSQIYSLRLDQSDVFTQAIPEPSIWALLILSAVVFPLLRRRRAA